jgi:hypothetical protein
MGLHFSLRGAFQVWLYSFVFMVPFLGVLAWALPRVAPGQRPSQHLLLDIPPCAGIGSVCVAGGQDHLARVPSILGPCSARPPRPRKHTCSLLPSDLGWAKQVQLPPLHIPGCLTSGLAQTSRSGCTS